MEGPLRLEDRLGLAHCRHDRILALPLGSLDRRLAQVRHGLEQGEIVDHRVTPLPFRARNRDRQVCLRAQ